MNSKQSVNECIYHSSMATSLSSMGGMGGSCLQQRDPATAAAYPSYMFAHHASDPLSSLQSSYNQRAAAAAAACSAAQASSVASAHSYAASNAHAQTGQSFKSLLVCAPLHLFAGLIV